MTQTAPPAPPDPDDFAGIENMLSRYRPAATPTTHARDRLAREALATRWYNQIESLAAAFLLAITLLTVALASPAHSRPREAMRPPQHIALPPLEPGFAPDEGQLAALRFAAGTHVKPVPEIRGQISLPSFNSWGVTP